MKAEICPSSSLTLGSRNSSTMLLRQLTLDHTFMGTANGNPVRAVAPELIGAALAVNNTTDAAMGGEVPLAHTGEEVRSTRAVDGQRLSLLGGCDSLGVVDPGVSVFGGGANGLCGTRMCGTAHLPGVAEALVGSEMCGHVALQNVAVLDSAVVVHFDSFRLRATYVYGGVVETLAAIGPVGAEVLESVDIGP